MKAHDYTTLVCSERDNRANFHTMLSCVVPRPIAFVSTITAAGLPNLAPFSFFNGVGSNPPAVVFSPATKADGTDKDTLNNLREVPECVIHIVPYDIRDAMNHASAAFPPDVDEFVAAGFTKLESRFVKPPRAAECPVQMECKLLQIVPVGSGPLSANVCVAEILCFHIADDHLVAENGTADVTKLDAIARMGGDWYARITDRFQLPKPPPP